MILYKMNFCVDIFVIYICTNRFFFQERPYHYDSTASRLLSEVKHNRARLVLRWGTTLESLVLFFSNTYLLNVILTLLLYFSPPLPPTRYIRHTYRNINKSTNVITTSSPRPPSLSLHIPQYYNFPINFPSLLNLLKSLLIFLRFFVPTKNSFIQHSNILYHSRSTSKSSLLFSYPNYIDCNTLISSSQII